MDEDTQDATVTRLVDLVLPKAAIRFAREKAAPGVWVKVAMEDGSEYAVKVTLESCQQMADAMQSFAYT